MQIAINSSPKAGAKVRRGKKRGGMGEKGEDISPKLDGSRKREREERKEEEEEGGRKGNGREGRKQPKV